MLGQCQNVVFNAYQEKIFQCTQVYKNFFQTKNFKTFSQIKLYIKKIFLQKQFFAILILLKVVTHSQTQSVIYHQDINNTDQYGDYDRTLKELEFDIKGYTQEEQQYFIDKLPIYIKNNQTITQLEKDQYVFQLLSNNSEFSQTEFNFTIQGQLKYAVVSTINLAFQNNDGNLYLYNMYTLFQIISKEQLQKNSNSLIEYLSSLSKVALLVFFFITTISFIVLIYYALQFSSKFNAPIQQMIKKLESTDQVNLMNQIQKGIFQQNFPLNEESFWYQELKEIQDCIYNLFSIFNETYLSQQSDNFLNAKLLYGQCNILFQKNQNHFLQSVCCSNLGNIYYHEKNYHQAAEYYDISVLLLYETIQDFEYIQKNSNKTIIQNIQDYFKKIKNKSTQKNKIKLWDRIKNDNQNFDTSLLKNYKPVVKLFLNR
ncbi:hypothetical protein PPERSA_04515 [Pseudocohnilembus persalinus]|uniref:Transmembrane protein n=1 Tax=Pseudocohnilembus persalinus TaxID=266149 RepID=A0A0V0QTF8_PSEPJ|nr:hypothetical protein PPERSA_04515 [Pseudocohnilembus persalinus]|eukprot:KRX05478.1 hypothetical protein PPERSA_04515 [Pseudocohnilembus persalinus]